MRIFFWRDSSCSLCSQGRIQQHASCPSLSVGATYRPWQVQARQWCAGQKFHPCHWTEAEVPTPTEKTCCMGAKAGTGRNLNGLQKVSEMKQQGKAAGPMSSRPELVAEKKHWQLLHWTCSIFLLTLNFCPFILNLEEKIGCSPAAVCSSWSNVLLALGRCWGVSSGSKAMWICCRPQQTASPSLPSPREGLQCPDLALLPGHSLSLSACTVWMLL